QGVRCVGVVETGEVVGLVEHALAPPLPTSPGRSEQDAEGWWVACCEALQALCAGLGKARLAAVCVDSTSGTFVPVDAACRPLRPAIMYDDSRAVEEATEVGAAAKDFTQRLGYGFPATFALPKMLWLARHEPRVWEHTARILHAADFIVARLVGEARYSDWSNALKTGYDLLERQWPEFLHGLGLDVGKLPEVVPPGTMVGEVTAAAAAQTGLPPGLPVVAGCTDGTASFLASGASRPGEWNSTLGTTLAIRGVAKDLIRDPQGRIYCHLHPDGFWLPGGASNTGAGPLAAHFGEEFLKGRSAEAAAGAPYEAIVYPLAGRGERLPLACPTAEGFAIDEPEEELSRLGAWMQGQALVERWCFDLCEELGCELADWIAVTGAASRNDAWLQLRADVLGREVRRPKYPAAAYGAALLAMAGVTGRRVSELSSEMVRFETVVEPRRNNEAVFQRLLDRLKKETQARWL
ncbi:MAG: FGGY-family carbohydrate kinase, partial [Armatimonadetes bacterium]|nr:FGGY-family carbohydrate kinase [Armatimonadota bacterium]